MRPLGASLHIRSVASWSHQGLDLPSPDTLGPTQHGVGDDGRRLIVLEVVTARG